jgi:hypothetical protein
MSRDADLVRFQSVVKGANSSLKDTLSQVMQALGDASDDDTTSRANARPAVLGLHVGPTDHEAVQDLTRAAGNGEVCCVFLRGWGVG